MKNGLLNQNEPHQVQIWTTSAGDKNSFAYDKTIEFLEGAIINPNQVAIFGCDYQLPVYCGLLPKNFLNEMKSSTTFSESGFAKEYMSRFVGGSSEAWFDYDKLLSCRKLVNPETHEKSRDGIESFYIISVDVARLGCQTVATVIKVFPNSEQWHYNLVNVYILGKVEQEKVFDHQVLELKRLIKQFNPREVVIDINGVGAPFGDTMIKETYDPQTGQTLPPYGFFNRDEYEIIQPKKCQKILYGIKATAELNSLMHSTLYSKIYSGTLKMLISEQDARVKLLSTVQGKHMSPEQRIQRLLPHEMTSILINEIMNLKLSPTGVTNQIKVEQINKRLTKDKFSALEMGIYRCSVLEQEFAAKRRNRGLKRQLVFFKSGGEK